MKYVVECEGSVYGPFDNDALAAGWTRNHCAGRAWRCRPLRAPAGGRE